ncbi:HAMP domain-containing protein [Acidaminobacter sp. JC074]|uniref:ATP-binding protein n=1 Tax=Acidaminobacter sp. JC074 TaxID=2530199 RepID=UPI001F10632E|nr:ATP-binding protein [Acidaminobacter sp. JC074]MCH4888780.1 HAMP domain-containing protein [Acidaminobacter sp. JC074]
MRTIRMKVFLLITTSILLISLIISSIVMLKSKQTFHDLAIEAVRETVVTHAKNFDDQLNFVKKTAHKVEIIIENLLDIKRLNEPGYLEEFEEELAPLIYSLADEGKLTKSAYIFFDPSLDGQTHDVWYTDLDDNGNLMRQEEFPMSFYENLSEGDEWYSEPKRTLEPYWTKPYHGSVDFDQHVIYVSHTRPVVINNQFIGVAGSDYHFSTMIDEITKLDMYDGYAILMNEYGEIIVHPTEEVGSSLLRDFDGRFEDITLEMIKKDRGYVSYKWLNDEDKFMVFETLENGWKFAVAVEDKAITSWYRELQIVLAFITFGIMVVELILGYHVSKQITRPIEHLVSHVEEISLGNYEESLPRKLLDMKDETGSLSKSVESMRIGIRNNLNEIRAHLRKLEDLVSERTFSLIENHKHLEEALVENDIQTKELKDVNEKLEALLKEMQEAQKALIETEKIASMNAVMTRMAYEIFTPMDNFEKLYNRLNQLRNHLAKKYDQASLTKRDLLETLMEFDEQFVVLLDYLDQMSGLVESFKALDPYTDSMTSNFEMGHLAHVVIDSIMFPSHVGVEVLCHEPVHVNLDATKMSSVLHHLLDNAAKHAFSGLSSGLVVVDIFMRNNKLHITVKDNGIGIDKDILDNVLRPIYHAEHTSGYGLMIAYNLVVQFFAGSIDCQTDENFGSEFRISIALDEKV